MSAPPGISGQYVNINSGGDEVAWLPVAKAKHFTNAFVVDEKGQRILLGYKKRGIGQDLWNGFGGKVEEGETVTQAAARELKEECSIEGKPVPCGFLLFTTAQNTSFSFFIHIFRVEEWTGEPVETDEMRPKWFSTNPDQTTSESDAPSIPYDGMWADDIYWLPKLLAKIPFQGRADFSVEENGPSGGAMVKWWFGEQV
ncbi:hypothetical protein SISSUDRAFT_1045765 [Sistotremastrum suecicum HHB10207 ss-3]|uniref:Oxidized purine nucleoside triphosphate hydrolase n=1 Tax=Sistotremastrum suecicum HHB10207 ss-3 TaxID=1314776 RepID=A0A166E818_9AGAM|nr:hypothetical protein SISSUDRAFT_1045765 [Sistotremastrum suecicum HHB10207 ss-3]